MGYKNKGIRSKIRPGTVFYVQEREIPFQNGKNRSGTEKNILEPLWAMNNRVNPRHFFRKSNISLTYC
jgi:hypothetical protein